MHDQAQLRKSRVKPSLPKEQRVVRLGRGEGGLHTLLYLYIDISNKKIFHIKTRGAADKEISCEILSKFDRARGGIGGNTKVGGVGVAAAAGAAAVNCAD